MKRWSKCWRRVVNRVLTKVLSSTNWHAFVGDKTSQSDYRTLFFGRDDAGVEGQVKRGSLGWSLCNRLNTLKFTLTLRHNEEDTFILQLSLPWLVSLVVSVDVGLLEWIERKVGHYGEARYGVEVDHSGYWLGWRANEEAAFQTFTKRGFWADLHGAPKVTVTTGASQELVYTQPGDKVFPQTTTHDLLLIPRTTRRSWPRFWKKDELQTGYELYFDQPPPIPARGIARLANRTTDGIYGTFIEAVSPGEAISRYREMVLRERGVLSA
jgi:hypothetical protein